MSNDQTKILRIGVVQLGSGKVTETRLIKRRDTVTVGSAPKNTFALPSPGLPQSFALFEMKGGQYHLHFTDKMDGKLSVGDEPQVDFHSLVTQGLAKKQSDGSHTLLASAVDASHCSTTGASPAARFSSRAADAAPE